MLRGAETSGLNCGELFFFFPYLADLRFNPPSLSLGGLCVHVHVLVASTFHYRPIPHRFCQSTRPEGAEQIIYRIYSRNCAISSSAVKAFAQLNTADADAASGAEPTASPHHGGKKHLQRRPVNLLVFECALDIQTMKRLVS